MVCAVYWKGFYVMSEVQATYNTSKALAGHKRLVVLNHSLEEACAVGPGSCWACGSSGIPLGSVRIPSGMLMETVCATPTNSVSLDNI